MDTTVFTIPIGTVYGDTLHLFQHTFLPQGWSYALSDTQVIHAPDTVVVKIIHDRLIGCTDTGRVIVYAYDQSGTYAGNAELRVYGIGKRGDLDNNDTVSVSDLGLMSSFIYRFGPSPVLLETAELTGDKRVDIADMTKLVDHLFVSHNSFTCERDTGYVGSEIRINATFSDDTTIISFNSPTALRGLQCALRGTTGATPLKILGDSLDLLFGQLHDSLRIAFADTNGGAMIPSGIHAIIKLRGQYDLIEARASDVDFHSVSVRVGPLTSTDSVEQGIPKSYALHQNYPNPFNPITVVRYDLPQASTVMLNIYDILGQEVKTLVNEAQDLGYKTVVWNSTNNFGNQVATGVYFYRLEAHGIISRNTFVQVKKMLVLK